MQTDKIVIKTLVLLISVLLISLSGCVFDSGLILSGIPAEEHSAAVRKAIEDSGVGKAARAAEEATPVIHEMESWMKRTDSSLNDHSKRILDVEKTTSSIIATQSMLSKAVESMSYWQMYILVGVIGILITGLGVLVTTIFHIVSDVKKDK